MKHLLILFLSASIVGCTTASPPVYKFSSKVETHGARIAFMGDTQRTGHIEFFRRDYEDDRQAIARQLASDDVDALVILGDMTFWGALPSDWRYFDALMKPIRAKNIPMYPVMGNHEYFIDGAQTLQNIKTRFVGFSNTWYSAVVDSVGIIVLNTNHSDIGNDAMNEQYRWFKSKIADWDKDPAIQFVIVSGHHPPFTNSSVVDPDLVLSKYFVPIFTNASKTSFWFSGHCHGYERFTVQGKSFIVSGGGGGPLQAIACGSDKKFADEYNGDVHRPFHYCVLERSGKMLSVHMVPLAKSMAVADSVSIGTMPELFTSGTD